MLWTFVRFEYALHAVWTRHTCYLCDALQRLLSYQCAYELVPFLHPGTLLTHIIPAIVALRAHVLQRMILDPVSNFLRNARLSGKGLPRSSQVAVRDDRNDAAISLPPHEAVERAMTDRRRGSLAEGKNQPYALGLMDSINSAASDGMGIA